MRVMVLVKASAASEAGEMPGEDLLTEMGRFNEELSKAGVMLAGEGLHPSARGVRVRCDGKLRTVIDGPFAETKELVAGFWLWQVASMQEAVDWIRRQPLPGGRDRDPACVRGRGLRRSTHPRTARAGRAPAGRERTPPRLKHRCRAPSARIGAPC